MSKEEYNSPLAGDDEIVELDEDYNSTLANEDVIELDSDFESSLSDDDEEIVELQELSENETLEVEHLQFEDEEIIDINDLSNLEGDEDTDASSEVVTIDPQEIHELSKEEAQELTEHIRSTADVLYVLVARAHAGKAHKALGYPNFGAYVKAEFNISRSRAYQLINQAEIINAIEHSTPDGTQIRLTELAARELKNYVDVLVPAVKEQTEGLTANEAGAVVEEIVNDFREKSQQEKEAKELLDLSSNLSGDDFEIDFDDMPEFDMPEFGGEGGTGGGSPFDNMDDFDNLDGLLDDDKNTGAPVPGMEFDDPNTMREKIENVYAFYSALTALQNMGNVDDIINSIQDARKEHINKSLPKAKEWLDHFYDVWFEKQKDEDTTESEASVSETDLDNLNLDHLDLDDTDSEEIDFDFVESEKDPEEFDGFDK